MTGIRSIAALALLATPGVRIGDDLMAETDRGDWDDVLFGGLAFVPQPDKPRRAQISEPVEHIHSPEIPSKRKRRRLRGRK